MRKLSLPFCAIFLSVAPVTLPAVTIQLIADNDFAVYAGTSTSITRSVYQNGVVWNSQIAAAASFTFDLEVGETTFYLLVMGGGVQENISGKINGVNIVAAYEQDNTSVRRSSTIQTLLSSYDTATVANGSYTPTLESVQAALAAATWLAPTVETGTTVVAANPHADVDGTRKGFNVPTNSAVFFRFDAETVNVPIVPEPGAAVLFGAGALAAGLRRRRAR